MSEKPNKKLEDLKKQYEDARHTVSQLNLALIQAELEEALEKKRTELGLYTIAIPVFGYLPVGEPSAVTDEQLRIAQRLEDNFVWSIRKSQSSFDDGAYFILVKNQEEANRVIPLLIKLAAAEGIFKGFDLKNNAKILTGLEFPDGWKS
jgi:hypothetical protein